MNLGLQYRIVELDHASFLEGRAASILIGDEQAGMVGELHPQVLENWGVQNPAVAFELNARTLLSATANR